MKQLTNAYSMGKSINLIIAHRGKYYKPFSGGTERRGEDSSGGGGRACIGCCFVKIEAASSSR